MRIVRFAALAAAASVAALSITSPAGAASFPVRHTLAAGVAAALADPAAPPPGVNVGCRPSATHPRPVVLVNGTFANMTDDWSYLGPTLANAGYCVYSTVLGADPDSFIQTTGPVIAS